MAAALRKSRFGDTLDETAAPAAVAAAPKKSRFGDSIVEGPPKLGAPMQAAIHFNSGLETTLGAPADLSRSAINAVTQPDDTLGMMMQQVPIIGPIIGLAQQASQ